MGDSSDEFFYNHVIDLSSDSSDDDSEILVAAALLIHDHEQGEPQEYRVSVKGHARALDR